MRIKVLDVLSFVLLINRQFYEVCTGRGHSGLKPGRGGRGMGWPQFLSPLGLFMLQQS